MTSRDSPPSVRRGNDHGPMESTYSNGLLVRDRRRRPASIALREFPNGLSTEAGQGRLLPAIPPLSRFQNHQSKDGLTFRNAP